MKLVSTRDPQCHANFRQAVLAGVAPGGGLWMPDPLPVFPDWPELLDLGWSERCAVILDRLLAEELGREPLARAAREALDFPVPLVSVRPGIFALELFHGPTLAFKDFGARFFAAVLDLVREPGRPHRLITILTATSGDTGAAVASAFWRRPGVRVVVLYPKGRVSALQELQFATLGDNVTALAVDGAFDDCQALVKAAFADADLTARHGLTSANSINVARLLPQTLYYAEAVATLRHLGIAEPPVIAVPSGNFGNLCAGLLARAMGLPVKAFVAATNANTTVPEYLDTGNYRTRPSVATLSNAMDVGAPNNWERIEYLFNEDLDALRRVLRWGARSDQETERSIRDLQTHGYLADPHAAVAYGVLKDRLAPGETGVFLGTAHPAKFLPVYERLGIEVEIPQALSALQGRPFLAREIANDFEALREVLAVG
ncbi:MAG TPA: threonine synthase [Thermoanaerobaculia bacterium]|nr:threonine synthase [Thermoanaerobaculia bacterium]